MVFGVFISKYYLEFACKINDKTNINTDYFSGKEKTISMFTLLLKKLLCVIRLSVIFI